MAISAEKQKEHKARSGMFDDFEKKADFEDTSEIEFFPRATRGLRVRVRHVEAGPKPMKKKTLRVQVCFEILVDQDGYKKGDIHKWYQDDEIENYWHKALREFASALYNVRRSEVTGAILEVIFFDVSDDGEACEPAILGGEVLVDVVPNSGGREDKRGNLYMNFNWHVAPSADAEALSDEDIPF